MVRTIPKIDLTLHDDSVLLNGRFRLTQCVAVSRDLMKPQAEDGTIFGCIGPTPTLAANIIPEAGCQTYGEAKTKNDEMIPPIEHESWAQTFGQNWRTLASSLLT
ncbi:hypothetical protein DMENIID0001_035300 [Sergentomyia squamirostris]